MFPHNNTLTRLDISYGQFDVNGAIHIAEGLTGNRSLEHLDVGNRLLSYWNIPMTLVEAIKDHPALKKLIWGDSFSDRNGETKCIEDYMINNCTIVGHQPH